MSNHKQETEDEGIEVAACPFCRSNAHVALDIMNLRTRLIIAIQCTRCNVRMHRHIKRDSLDSETEIILELVSNWNNRKKIKEPKS